MAAARTGSRLLAPMIRQLAHHAGTLSDPYSDKRGQSRLAFTSMCAYTSTFCSSVRNLTRGALSIFDLAQRGLTERSRTGAEHFGASWSGTVATTARNGARRAWSAPRGATSPTGTSATSRRAASRSRASGRSKPSAGRWGCRSRSGRAFFHARRTGQARQGDFGDGR